MAHGSSRVKLAAQGCSRGQLPMGAAGVSFLGVQHGYAAQGRMRVELPMGAAGLSWLPKGAAGLSCLKV